MKREVWMAKYMREKSQILPVQVPLDPECRELVFKMHNGTEISVEIFDRDGYPGVKIRALDGLLVVEPEASNTVVLRVETYEENSKRYRT